MHHPSDLKYSRHHIWVRLEEQTAYVGMTEDVHEEIEHFESVDLPRVGDELAEAIDAFEVDGVKGGRRYLYIYYTKYNQHFRAI